jgi:hypothetical protein
MSVFPSLTLAALSALAGAVAAAALIVRGRGAERDRQWHDALWKALPEMPRGAGDKHAPDSPETVEWCIGAALADIQADLARVVAERDVAREEAAKLREKLQIWAPTWALAPSNPDAGEALTEEPRP